MGKNERREALQFLVDRRYEVVQSLVDIRELDNGHLETRGQQLLYDFEKVVGDYESAVDASRSYLHVWPVGQLLNKSCKTLKQHFRFVESWLSGTANRPTGFLYQGYVGSCILF